MYVKYDIRASDFRPVDHSRVRWLNDDDFPVMSAFADMDRVVWDDAKKEGYTYCAVIEDGKIAALAAVWKYSPDKWETAAVVTCEDRRNRGLAKQVVSFVTAYTLSQGKTPTLTTRQDNLPMRKVAQAIGYTLL